MGSLETPKGCIETRERERERERERGTEIETVGINHNS